MEYPFGVETEGEKDGFETGRRDVTYSDIASKLIKDKLWLTALELHAELVESGKEVRQLKEFFSNPVNFENQTRLDYFPSIPRSSSQATLDSLDMTRFSEDSERMNDDRVAVLEFELRKARETISALRADLTVATANEAAAPGSGLAATAPPSPIKPHEQKALDFLINEYLLIRGYKLTSITFSDENGEQDFEDWDNVGLNMPKPPELLHLYRAGLKYTGVSSKEKEIQTDALSSFTYEQSGTKPQPYVELNETKDQWTQCEKIEGTSDISGSFEELNQSEFDGPKPIQELEKSKLSLLQQTIDHDTSSREDVVEEEEEQISEGEKESFLEEKANLSKESYEEDKYIQDEELNAELDATSFVGALEASPQDEAIEVSSVIDPNLSTFESKVWSYLPAPKELECVENINHEVLIRYLGRSLHMILNQLQANSNKDWLSKIVPIIVCMIALHPEEKAKDDLLHCLLNLKKRPSQEDRNVIIAGIVGLCRKRRTDDTLMSQLLSQCGELMAVKYSERRVLVAQICAHLSRLIAPDLRDSLLLSMLKQLSEDRDENVRAQSIISLAAFGCNLVEEKYSEMESLSLQGLLDRSEAVVKATSAVLLPVAAKTALDRQCFHKSLVTNLLSTLGSTNTKDKQPKFCNVVDGFICILPHIVMYTASSEEVIAQISSSLPPPQQRTGFIEVCKGLSSPSVFFDKYPIGSVIGSFDYCLSQSIDWPELHWFVNDVLPSLLDAVDRIDPNCDLAVLSMAKLFRSLTAGFGAIFTTQYVKAAFLDRLESVEKALLRNNGWPPFWSITVYLIGVLAPLHSCEEELGSTITRFIVSLGISSAPLTCLQVAFCELAPCQRLTNTLMSSLWQGVVHQRASVRVATCSLFTQVLPHIPEHVVSSRIIPALITLASDADLSVKVATLPVYALVLQRSSTNKELHEKCHVQVQSVLSDQQVLSDPMTAVPIIRTLGEMSSHSDSYFREQVVLSALYRLTNAAFDVESHSPIRSQMASALVDSLSNVVFLPLSKNSITSTLLPTLRLLESLCKEAAPALSEASTSLIREVETRSGLNEIPSLKSPTSPTSSLSAAGVEEMRAKVSKIFNAAPKPSSLSSLGDIFRKNKP